jgi:hypothetical protein
LMQRYGLGEAEENPPTKDKSTSRRNQSRP